MKKFFTYFLSLYVAVFFLAATYCAFSYLKIYIYKDYFNIIKSVYCISVLAAIIFLRRILKPKDDKKSSKIKYYIMKALNTILLSLSVWYIIVFCYSVYFRGNYYKNYTLTENGDRSIIIQNYAGTISVNEIHNKIFLYERENVFAGSNTKAEINEITWKNNDLLELTCTVTDLKNKQSENKIFTFSF